MDVTLKIILTASLAVNVILAAMAYSYLKQQFGAADEPVFDPFFKQVWEVDLSGGARI